MHLYKAGLRYSTHICEMEPVPERHKPVQGEAATSCARSSEADSQLCCNSLLAPHPWISQNWPGQVFAWSRAEDSWDPPDVKTRVPRNDKGIPSILSMD